MSFIEGDEKKINRRDFTREAGLGGVAMAGVGAGPFLEANNPKSMSETLPKEWDLEAEVVVIGSGATGLPAAIRAADQGVSVIVVDANYDIGGHGIFSGGHVALGGGTSAQKKYGSEDAPEILFQDLTDW